MVRSFVGFLIIIAIFLTGMVFGIGKEDHQSIGDSVKLIDFNLDDQGEPEAVKMKDKNEDTPIVRDEHEEPKHLTQVVASSLESIVKGFYDMIVQLCYAFANLFF